MTVLLAWPATSGSGSANHHHGLRADLTHIDSGRGFTRNELLRRMVLRSRARAAKQLCPSRSGTPVRVTAPVASGSHVVGYTEYLIHFGIGTPRPQQVALEVDTGSDVVWTQCRPCFDCFTQPLPRFDTSASDTVHGVLCTDPICRALRPHACFLGGCTYQVNYGDNSVTIGQLAKDSFTFDGKGGGKVTVPDLVFGCGQYNTGNFHSNETGIAGFGRGPLSLPRQLGVSSFSYCFTTIFESKSTPVFLGGAPADGLRAHATGPILSTPFLPNHPEYYYLSLKGITVGKTRLAVPESAFVVKADGSGGTIIDSGTAITAFPRAVFRSLWEAFVAQVPLPHTSYNDTGEPTLQCFSTESVPDASKVPVPKMTLHLEGADWELPRENYMAEYPDSDQLCVVVLAGDDDRTMIGNFQQQNMHIVHDLAGNKLVIEPAQCDKM
ncbi:hypothetical protein ZWY2020_051481 [Hordeum vulgare]|nr:hypothetical protein ZWY2020_051481 [Hordeum vulgare]